MKTSNFTRHKNQSKGFTVIPTSISYDKDLSMQALGMLCKLYMLPDDWQFSEMGMVKSTGWGRDRVRTALKELESLGYLVRTQERDSNGKFGDIHWHIFETPVKVVRETGEVVEDRSNIDKYDLPNFHDQVINQSAPVLGAPTLENPTSGAPTSGAPTQYKYLSNNSILELNNLTIDPLGADRTEEPKSISEKPGEDQTSAIKVLKKKYKSAFVELALEVSKDKDNPLAYARTILREWKKQKFETVEQIKQHVANFHEEQMPAHLSVVKPYAGNRIKRVELTPEWLNQEQQSYNPNAEYTEEQLKAIDRMIHLQKIVLNPNHQSVEDDEFGLPF